MLFDVDGVLLDSYAGYREVWSRWCVLREVDLELAWAATHGRRPVETVAEVAPHLSPEDEYVVLKALLGEVGDLGWQESVKGDRDIRRELRKTLHKRGLTDDAVYDRAYAYIREHC